jgi:hypothetical protein
VENTQVTCHVGVPSCGQRHRNVFIALLLVLSLTQSLMIPLPRLHAPRLRPHHTDIANLLQDHISVHKHKIRHEYDYVAQTPLIRAASLAATTNSSYRATPPR